jgi:hypothetical protein
MRLSAIIISLSLLIALASTSNATDITENIVQDTTWTSAGNPWTIQTDIQVYPGIKLTIEPGVEVVIHIGASLIIGGTLDARGQQGNLIIFKSNLTIPAVNQPAGLVFESTAESANYSGDDQPVFSYDYVNREVKLTYLSGSVLEYCQFSGLSTAVELNNAYPYLSNNHITNCPYGIKIYAGRDIPLPQWFFLNHNTIENCSEQAMFVNFNFSGAYYFPFALFTGNIFQNNVTNDGEWAVYVSHFSGDTSFFLFNNQIINNKGTGLVHHGPYSLLYADSNQISGNNQGLTANNSILLNNTISNNTCPKDLLNAKAAGVYLNGPRAVLFNNTIQGNEICPGDDGDNIMLRSQQGNQFTAHFNNLGNSYGDSIDIYLDTDYQGVDCNTSKDMNVDALNNFWEDRNSNNLHENIFDFNDDFCAGSVDYQPVSIEKITPVHLTSAPTLIEPEHNALIPGTLTIDFSWQPVTGATKYLLCTNGWANIPSEAMRVIEVQGQTSAQVAYSPFTSYSQKSLYWYVVAGTDNGWGLPSEVRKLYFSEDPFVVGGTIADENENPVGQVYIAGQGEGVFSDVNGLYATIQSDNFTEGLIYSLKKEGYVDCYTFPRLSTSFDVYGDLTIISEAAKNAIYADRGIVPDVTKGAIAGVVVDENDQILIGAEVYTEPSSGAVFYLGANNLPDPTLTSTGPTGKFVILNVPPGNYRLSANLSGHNFSIVDNYGGTPIGPGIVVYENAITIDALAETSATANGGNPGSTPGATSESGGGGGGGCFVRALIK